jgi:hypothetical protein
MSNEILSRSEQYKTRIKPQTLLIRDKEGKIVSNKEKVLQRWSE